MLLFIKCFTIVIKANGSRACTWVLYLKYTGGKCSWDLQYCFMYLHSCQRPCKAKTRLFSRLQKDAEAEHLQWLLCTGLLSKGQGASHSLARSCMVVSVLIHPKDSRTRSPRCLLHSEMDINAEGKRSGHMSKPVNQVSLTLGWTQNFSHPQIISSCSAVQYHGSRLGQSFKGYDAGKHKQ